MITNSDEAAALRIGFLGNAYSFNTVNWVRALREAGSEVLVATVDEHPDPSLQAVSLGWDRWPRKLRLLQGLGHCRRLLRSWAPDVVVAYDAGGYGFLGALSGRRPVVVATAGSDVLIRPDKGLRGIITRFALRKADLVTAWAPHMREAIAKMGVPEERIYVQPRGIPVRSFAVARTGVLANSAAIRILSTRHLSPYYRLDVVLYAVARAQSEGTPCHVTMAGDGIERRRLVKLARTLGLSERARFPGRIPPEDLPQLMPEHDLYVSLSPTDGVSASLLEAMAAGLLPLVVDNAANRYWIEDGVNGILLRSDDELALAEAIRRGWNDHELRRRCIALNPPIVKRRADMYANARLFVNRFRELAEQVP